MRITQKTTIKPIIIIITTFIHPLSHVNNHLHVSSSCKSSLFALIKTILWELFNIVLECRDFFYLFCILRTWKQCKIIDFTIFFSRFLPLEKLLLIIDIIPFKLHYSQLRNGNRLCIWNRNLDYFSITSS